MRDHVSTRADEHLPPPSAPTPGDTTSITITAEEVLALLAYLGPDIVIEQLDHGNQHLWLTCPKHYDIKIALVVDFSDPIRFAPSTLSTDQINLPYTERAFELRNYGLRPCSADVTLETFAPPTRRQTRRNRTRLGVALGLPAQRRSTRHRAPPPARGGNSNNPLTAVLRSGVLDDLTSPGDG